MPRKFTSLSEYYPYYLSQHASCNCRRLHVVGSSVTIGAVVAALVHKDVMMAAYGTVFGYLLAWIGHIRYEDEQTPLEPLVQAYRNPVYGFLCDWMMFADVLRGKFIW